LGRGRRHFCFQIFDLFFGRLNLGFGLGLDLGHALVGFFFQLGDALLFGFGVATAVQAESEQESGHREGTRPRLSSSHSRYDKTAPRGAEAISLTRRGAYSQPICRYHSTVLRTPSPKLT